MQETAYTVAKREVGRALLQGCSWRDAVQAAGVQVSRATAYRLRQRMLAGEEAAWHDRRQGHVVNVRGAVRPWLEAYYQHHPHAPGKAVQVLLEEQGGVRGRVTPLNRTRAALLGATRRGEKSARDLAGWSWRSPVVGGSPANAPAPDAGVSPADTGRASACSPTGTGDPSNAAAVPADVALVSESLDCTARGIYAAMPRRG
jgi:hypothetical protein